MRGRKGDKNEQSLIWIIDCDCVYCNFVHVNVWFNYALNMRNFS